MSQPADAATSHDDQARAQLVELARAPGRRSELVDRRQAGELRAAIDALLARADSLPRNRRPEKNVSTAT